MTNNETSAKKNYEAVVEKAIKEITALGEEISVKEVIKLTGGSRRDIAPAVSRVKNRLRRRELRIWSAPDIPAAVQDLVADLWLQAFELASADFQTLSKDLQAKLSEQEQETGNYYNLMVETEDEASSWRSRAEASESLVVKLQDQIASLRDALHDATSRLEERREIEELLKSAIAVKRITATGSSLELLTESDSQTRSRNPNSSSMAK